MRTGSQQPTMRRWVLVFLAALVAVLATLLSSASASAATQGTAETRVRASAAVVEVPVGPPEHISAGQRLGNDGPRVVGVVATGVAAEDGAVDEAPALAGPGPAGGESSAAAYGRMMHATYDYGPGFEREFALENGQRADAVNLETREVLELKPNNPRAIRLGTRQVQGYADQLTQEFPGDPFTWRVVTYDLP